jgi:hypothetical protein
VFLWVWTGFGLVIGFIELLENVINVSLALSLIHTLYSSLQHIMKSSQSAVFTSRCLAAASKGGRSPTMGYQTISVPQLPTSNSNSSQRPNCSSFLTDHQFTSLHCTQLPCTVRVSQSYFMTVGLPPISSSLRETP